MGEFMDEEIIRERLERNPEMARLFAEHFRIREADLPEMIGFNQYVFKETVDWLDGIPAGNTMTIYSGFGDQDSALNREVLRYPTNPDAETVAIRYHTPTGKIADPVLALHTRKE